MERSLAVFHRETREGGFGPSGGAMETMIVRGGLLRSEKYFRLLLNFAVEVVGGDDGGGPMCLACEYEFRRSGGPPTALAVTIPIHVAPSRAIISGVCEACARLSDEELTDRVYRDLKKVGLATAVMGYVGREN
jgi:hypothetical protein